MVVRIPPDSIYADEVFGHHDLDTGPRSFRFRDATRGFCMPREGRLERGFGQLPRPGREMINQISHHEHPQVHRGSSTFADSVIAVGVHHVVERLAELDQTIH